MKIVIQRVKKASVSIEEKVWGKIEQGLLVFVGIHKNDTPQDTRWLVNKLVNLRCFSDDAGKMNLSIQDIKGEILIISQFTLYGNCTVGRRPSFTIAAAPEQAIPIYEKFVSEVQNILGKIQTGKFGAAMEVSLINDGPVTFIIKSPLQN
jgi:D-aminoacyl-tRNA deacylase